MNQTTTIEATILDDRALTTYLKQFDRQEFLALDLQNSRVTHLGL